jgi:hypothetical protein
MEEGKKWSLLADPFDKSLLRPILAMEYAQALGIPFTSQVRLCRVWLNGKYRGVYTAVEPVDVKENRVEIDLDAGDFLFERNYNDIREEEGITYFKTNYGLRFELNEPEVPTAEQLDGAWQNAMTLLKKIGGNAAYLTFSASKVPTDAASGQIAAGMCIDYYGRSQAEWEEEHVGRPTIIYRTPRAGSSVSADPIGILRGAENRKLAEEFIDFVMSPEGQRLWGCRKGLPGGPRKYNLFRLPVRRDLYTAKLRGDYCFPAEENPFVMAEEFIYHGAWTARLFSLMRVLIKVMVIDCGPELRSCWKDILDKGGLDACTPEEQAAFSALPFKHQENRNASKQLSTPEGQATTVRNWILFFQENYRKAAGKHP